MSCSSLAHLSILPSTLPRLTDLVSFIFFFLWFHLSLSLLLPALCQVHTDGKQQNVVQTGPPNLNTGALCDTQLSLLPG